MSQVRRLDQIPPALDASLADQIAIWQSGRTRIGTLADLVAFFLSQVPPVTPVSPTLTTVSNVDYAVLPTDQRVGYTLLTASKQVGLPQSPLVPPGFSVIIGDFRGFCSPLRKITIIPAFGGSIGGQPSVEIQDAWMTLNLLHTGENVWVIV